MDGCEGTDLPRVSTWFGALKGSDGYKNGKAADARFYHPSAVVVFTVRPLTLFVADMNNYCIRFCNAASGDVTLFAGTPNSWGVRDGPTANCMFFNPTTLLVDSNQSNRVFVAEAYS